MKANIYIYIGGLVIGCVFGALLFQYNSPPDTSFVSKWHDLKRKGKSNGGSEKATTEYNKTDTNHRFMLSVLRQGRLGNGMSQYSALLGLANLTNRIPILNPGYRDLAQIFTISTPVQNRLESNKTFYRLGRKAPDVPLTVEAATQALRNISQNVMLEGYFQNFRFFSPVSKKIRKEFTFKKNIRRQVSRFFKHHNFTEKNVTKVGIHVRRTDLNTPSRMAQGFGCPPPTYFINAMKFFRNKYLDVHFVICSDDMHWTREHIKGDDVTFVSNNPPEVDMAIMTSCDHVIISNGSFSWWIGWLCRGTTVRYEQIPKYNTRLYNMTSGGIWPPDDIYNHYVAIDSDE
ncbi:hypothetical protein LSH36_748g02056 [Paralvinella palmiformis]|uniref:L-Fucosyltransferase n=1 Tax=Paralvinella palmiformis TaxID=53620 RepID=A0AAD9J1F7_9ANNE|nr:hypothetical protein LSH36_748g02056 [Paralvinella palmiformis]